MSSECAPVFCSQIPIDYHVSFTTAIKLHYCTKQIKSNDLILPHLMNRCFYTACDIVRRRQNLLMNIINEVRYAILVMHLGL